MRTSFVFAVALLFPVHVYAINSPTFSADRSLLVAQVEPGNVYAVGASVAVTTPVTGDLNAFGGSVIVTSPVTEDVFLTGGSVSLRAPVAGDARLFGGSLSIEQSVEGDLVAFGASVIDTVGGAQDVFVVGAHVALLAGAKGPVTVYGNTVTLEGSFAGDVHVIASGQVILAEETMIHGVLSYESPEKARIPESVLIAGGVKYQGPSYLPTTDQAKALILASFGVFLFVRFLAAIILAGLIAGLFPALSNAVADRLFSRPMRNIVLATMLGFAVVVTTPVLLFLLALTFVGLGIAFLLSAVYALLIILSFVYAGILIGAFIARKFLRRTVILWRDAVLGMLTISFIGLIPVFGGLLIFLLVFFSAGALTLIFFQYAFNNTK